MLCRSRWSRLIAAGAAAASLALLAPPSVEAQYFGRNNPQYRTFDFQVLQTEHFDIYYYPEEEEAVRDAARMAERWYDAALAHSRTTSSSERQPLILYASHPHFQQTNILGGPDRRGHGRRDRAFKQRVIMPFAHTYEETDHVLGHELVHAFQYDISGWAARRAGSRRRRALPGAALVHRGDGRVPLVGPVDAHTAMWLRDAALRARSPRIEQLTPTRASSPTAGATRSGPTSAAAGATR
jgi:hypothetical protein